jgi:hypothetical protein
MTLKFSAHMFNTCCSPETKLTFLSLYKFLLRWNPILKLLTSSKNFYFHLVQMFLPIHKISFLKAVSFFSYIFVSRFSWQFYILLSRLWSFFVLYWFVKCFSFQLHHSIFYRTTESCHSAVRCQWFLLLLHMYVD